MAPPVPRRRSMLELMSTSSSNLPEAALPAAGPASAGGFLGTLGGLVSHGVRETRDTSGMYNTVDGPPAGEARAEKSEWLTSQTSRRGRFRWTVGTIIAVIIIVAIVGGAIGGLRHSSSGNPVAVCTRWEITSLHLYQIAGFQIRFVSTPRLEHLSTLFYLTYNYSSQAAKEQS